MGTAAIRKPEVHEALAKTCRVWCHATLTTTLGGRQVLLTQPRRGNLIKVTD